MGGLVRKEEANSMQVFPFLNDKELGNLFTKERGHFNGPFIVKTGL